MQEKSEEIGCAVVPAAFFNVVRYKRND